MCLWSRSKLISTRLEWALTTLVQTYRLIRWCVRWRNRRFDSRKQSRARAVYTHEDMCAWSYLDTQIYTYEGDVGDNVCKQARCQNAVSLQGQFVLNLPVLGSETMLETVWALNGCLFL